MKQFDGQYNSLSCIKLKLNALTIYRGLLDDSVLKKLCTLLDGFEGKGQDISNIVRLYSDFCHELLIKGKDSYSTSLKEYIIFKVLVDENPFSLKAETADFEAINPSVLYAAAQDLKYLQQVSELSAAQVKQYIAGISHMPEDTLEIIKNLPEWSTYSSDTGQPSTRNRQFEDMRRMLGNSADWSSCLKSMSDFYRDNGCGLFSLYRAFTWSYSRGYGCLEPIEFPDPIVLKDLVGYESERSEVISNTEMLLRGFNANNILLYGDRGTGKSTTVKAVANEFHCRGLRLVEMPKDSLIDFPKLVKALKGRSCKFIIFIDDLSFEDSEAAYTALKAVIEGGVEAKPPNAVIYATSNRRHLIKEKFSDRIGLSSSNQDDEVKVADTMQEKLSLADRFGITIVYSAPDKNNYLKIVEGLAEKRGLRVDIDYLHREAQKWALWYNGRSPRTARQFIDWLEGQQ